MTTSAAVLQPAVAPTPFGAVVARQLSVWPFAARTARLFVLVDPSVRDERLRQGLLRAMQHGYFASDGYSQTRAVREAALAAHYVLRHRNRDELNRVNAASAVAAVRGRVAFVALAGDAAAFAWRDGELSRQQGLLRLPRPLGLDHDPSITVWRSPLSAGDRLVLVCGATWQSDSDQTIGAILSSTSSNAAAQRELASALGDGGESPAGVLVIAPTTPGLQVPHLRLVTSAEPPPAPRAPATETISPLRLLFPILGLLLLAMVSIVALVLAPQPSTLAAHTAGVTPHLAVRLGPAAANVVDMVAGDSALYTLDVAEGAIHAFPLDALDQQPTADTVLARTGTSLDPLGHALGLPVAIEYLPRSGSLAIVDQSRSVVQIGADRNANITELPTSATWQALGALGSVDDGRLLFLDSRAGRVLSYPVIDDQVVDSPDLVLDHAQPGNLPFERVAQVLGTSGSLVMRLDDGSLHAIDAAGADRPFALSSPVSGMAPDRAGGLYLANPVEERIVQARLDGTVLRELEAPALAGVRAIDVSVDGHRLYALVESGILVIDLPPM